MDNYPNIISYLKKCFESDNRSSSVSNIFSSKITQRHFFKKASIFDSDNEYYLLENNYAEKVQKELQLHVTEKELKIGLFFLNFETNFLGRLQNNVTPLLLFDAEIIQDEFYFLKVNFDSVEINITALNLFDQDSVSANLNLTESVKDIIKTQRKLDYGCVSIIQRELSKFIPEINFQGFDHYPKMVSQKKLKEKSLNDQINLKSGGCCFIKEKSKNTQSILQELSQIISNTDYSKLLQSYLSQNFITKELNSDSFKPSKVPAILSESQEKILSEIPKNQCSVVTGPPGTGKSFTIAATAMNEAFKGKSVLIVTGSEHANDAIESKFIKDFGVKNLTARVSRSRGYKSKLKNDLRKWLQGIGLTAHSAELESIISDIDKTDKRLKRYERKIQKITKDEIKLGGLIYDKRKGIIKRIKTYFFNNSLKTLPIHGQLLDQYSDTLAYSLKLRKRFIRSSQASIIKNNISKNREYFVKFREALNSKLSGDILALYEQIDFKVLTSVFPIWISKVSDVGTGIPLQKELFDYIIIDEASQLDLTSIIPVLQRGKQLIVCGDTAQLSPVTFLSKSKMEQFAKELKTPSLSSQFDYTKLSFLDVCHSAIKKQEQLFFLDEHYRCLPDIIAYSNANFYDHELRVLTQLPKNKDKIGLRPVFCNGKRNENGTNEIESKKIVEQVNSIIEKYIESKSGPSIGILSPYRKQTEHLRKLISQVGLKLMKKHQIICGTAHSFQGNERDIMLISTVVDDNSHHGAFMHINKPDVFNVSITRAKNIQYVYHSLTRDCKHHTNLLYDFLFEAQHKVAQEEFEQFDDLSLEKVVDFIKSNCNVEEYEIDYQIAGIKVDIWAKINGKYYGFDAIGFPGEFESAIHINKLKILGRLGIKMIPITLSNFINHPEKLAKTLPK